MRPNHNPETEPFELKLSNLPPTAPDYLRDALVHVNENVDFAKRILLQNRVRDFSASDVIEVAKMIVQQQEIFRARIMGTDGEDE